MSNPITLPPHPHLARLPPPLQKKIFPSFLRESQKWIPRQKKFQQTGIPGETRKSHLPHFMNIEFEKLIRGLSSLFLRISSFIFHSSSQLLPR